MSVNKKIQIICVMLFSSFCLTSCLLSKGIESLDLLDGQLNYAKPISQIEVVSDNKEIKVLRFTYFRDLIKEKPVFISIKSKTWWDSVDYLTYKKFLSRDEIGKESKITTSYDSALKEFIQKKLNYNGKVEAVKIKSNKEEILYILDEGNFNYKVVRVYKHNNYYGAIAVKFGFNKKDVEQYEKLIEEHEIAKSAFDEIKVGQINGLRRKTITKTKKVTGEYTTWNVERAAYDVTTSVHEIEYEVDNPDYNPEKADKLESERNNHYAKMMGITTEIGKLRFYSYFEGL